MQKVQANLIIAVKVRVSPPPISVLTSQTALTDWQNIIVGPCHLPKILWQKGKSSHWGDFLRAINDFCVRLQLSILSVVYYFGRKHFAGELAENMLVRFIFNGRELRHDASTLQSCNITDGSVIHCLLTRAAQQEENTEQQQRVPYERTTSNI